PLPWHYKKRIRDSESRIQESACGVALAVTSERDAASGVPWLLPQLLDRFLDDLDTRFHVRRGIVGVGFVLDTEVALEFHLAQSLSRLSKLSGLGSALNAFTPRFLPNSKTRLLASCLLVKPCTPQATGVIS